MMWKLKRFWRNIVRTYKLAKLTWNSCSCDYSEATDLFMFGLRSVVDHIEEHKNFIGWEYTVQRGKTLIRLGERVYSEYYALLPFDHIDNEPLDDFLARSGKEPLRGEIYAAQKKQEKAQRIYYKLLDHRLQWLWD